MCQIKKKNFLCNKKKNAYGTEIWVFMEIIYGKGESVRFINSAAIIFFCHLNVFYRKKNYEM